MYKPTEKEIEMYVRFPEELDKADSARIEKSLEENKDLKLLAEWFTSFYDLEDELWKRQNPQMIKVKAIHLVPMPEEPSNKNRRFVLSAQTAVYKKRILPVNTFISEKHRTLMRILNYKENKVTRIHIVSDQVESDDIVLLQVDDKNLYLASEPGGKMEISNNMLGKKEIEKWEFCTLHLPLFKAIVNRKSTQRNGYIGAKSEHGIRSIEVSQAKDEVIVSAFSETEKDNPGIMLIKWGMKTSLWKMHDGNVAVPGNQFRNKRLSLFFYQ